jgi:hypothetical protein
MILHDYLVWVLHHQRLEEALRKEPELRMIREIERSPTSRRGWLLTSIVQYLSGLLANRQAVRSRGRAPSCQPDPTYLSCVDGLPDELPCRAA